MKITQKAQQRLIKLLNVLRLNSDQGKPQDLSSLCLFFSDPKPSNPLLKNLQENLKESRNRT